MESIGVWSQRSKYKRLEPVTLEMRAGDGKFERLTLSVWNVGNGKVVERRSVTPGPSGRKDVELKQLPTGSYGVKLEAYEDGKVVATAHDSFSISGLGLEMTQTVPRPDILQKIAAATGGNSLDYANAQFANPKVDGQQKFQVDASVSSPLISHWWMLILISTLFASEWFLRRRWGLA